MFSAHSSDVLYTTDILSVIPLTMKFHSENSEVQEAAANLLMAVSAQGKGFRHMSIKYIYLRLKSSLKRPILLYL